MNRALDIFCWEKSLRFSFKKKTIFSSSEKEYMQKAFSVGACLLAGYLKTPREVFFFQSADDNDGYEFSQAIYWKWITAPCLWMSFKLV